MTPSEALQGASAFWRWWIAELGAMIPRGLAAPRLTRRPRVEIEVASDKTVVERVSAELGERFVDPTPLSQIDDEAWQQLADISEGATSRLILSAPDIYATRLFVPKQARSRLRDVVALQLDEIAPVDPNGLRWTIAAVVPEGERLAVELVMAKHDRIEELLGLFETHGLEAPAVAARIGDRTILLEAPTSRLGRSARPRAPLIAMALIGSIPLTILLVAILLIWSNERAQAAIADAAADRLHAEQRVRRAALARTALAGVAKTVSASQILDDLAGRLPDNANLTTATRDGAKLTLEIDTDDPDAVRDALGHDMLFRFEEANESPNDDGRMHVTYRGVWR